MAWIGFGLDDTLVTKTAPVDEESGMISPAATPEDVPTDGAIEAVSMLANEGHRLTVFTSRFKAMPDSEKQRLKEEIEAELQQLGFPPMEVWTGTVKPDLDAYVGNEAITFDGDWPLVLAQLYHTLSDQGLAPPPQEQADEEGQDQEGQQQPQEEA